MLSKIDTKNFPYGKASKTLTKAVGWLNGQLRKGRVFEDFDFPDYGGLPKAISARLLGDEVDWLQSVL